MDGRYSGCRSACRDAFSAAVDCKSEPRRVPSAAAAPARAVGPNEEAAEEGDTDGVGDRLPLEGCEKEPKERWEPAAPACWCRSCADPSAPAELQLWEPWLAVEPEAAACAPPVERRLSCDAGDDCVAGLGGRGR